MSNKLPTTPMTEINIIIYSFMHAEVPTLVNDLVDHVVKGIEERFDIDTPPIYKALVRDGIKQRMSQRRGGLTINLGGHTVPAWQSLRLHGSSERMFIETAHCTVNELRVSVKQREKENAVKQKNWKKYQVALEKILKMIPDHAASSDKITKYV